MCLRLQHHLWCSSYRFLLSNVSAHHMQSAREIACSYQLCWTEGISFPGVLHQASCCKRPANVNSCRKLLCKGASGPQKLAGLPRFRARACRGPPRDRQHESDTKHKSTFGNARPAHHGFPELWARRFLGFSWRAVMPALPTLPCVSFKMSK